MDINSIIGIAGMILILAGFILDITHKLTARSTVYLWLNIIGGGLLLYYSIALKSVPFAILQAVWAIAALTKLIFRKS